MQRQRPYQWSGRGTKKESANRYAVRGRPPRMGTVAEWQARGFYLKHGQEEYARIDDYVPGRYLALMKKSLAGPAP